MFANKVSYAPAFDRHFALLHRYGEPSLKEALKCPQQSLPYKLLTYLHIKKKDKILIEGLDAWQKARGILCTESTQDGTAFQFIYKSI